MVGEDEDPAPFLDSWQVPSSLTSVGQTRFRLYSCATADCSPCIRMLSNGTFSACHSFVCAAWVRRRWGALGWDGRIYLQRGQCRGAGGGADLGEFARGVEFGGSQAGSLQRPIITPEQGCGERGPGCGGSREAALPDARAQVSPESFCELWIRDTKYVQQPCVALTVYAAMCHKFHVCIDWRRSDYCRELVGGVGVSSVACLLPQLEWERACSPESKSRLSRFNYLLIQVHSLMNSYILEK